jgi:hypothetical protein
MKLGEAMRARLPGSEFNGLGMLRHPIVQFNEVEFPDDANEETPEEFD